MKLNNLIINTETAVSIYYNELVYAMKKFKRDIITLSLGESFFSIPNFGFEKIDFDNGYHYSSSRGIEELRKKISQMYLKEYKAKISSDNIIISSGSKIIFFMCFKCLLNKKDDVLIQEPAWISYTEQIKLAGANPVIVPRNRNLKEYITNKTKIIVVCNPNNPTGKNFTKKELTKIYRECKKKDITLIVDEAYSAFTPKKFFSSLRLDKNLKNLIIINSLSKNMGMSGWRIGYLISNENFLDNFLKINQHLITCAPTVLQKYISYHFEKILSFTTPQIKKLLILRKNIKKILTDLELNYLEGDSTFYFFLDLSKYKYDIHLLALTLLLEHGISLVPGKQYGVNTEKFLRLSIGTESEERIIFALKVLKSYIEKKPLSKTIIKKKLKEFNLKYLDEVNKTK